MVKCQWSTVFPKFSHGFPMVAMADDDSAPFLQREERVFAQLQDQLQLRRWEKCSNAQLGGLEEVLTATGWWFGTWLLFSIIYGMSSFPLTNFFQAG